MLPFAGTPVIGATRMANPVDGFNLSARYWPIFVISGLFGSTKIIAPALNLNVPPPGLTETGIGISSPMLVSSVWVNVAAGVLLSIGISLIEALVCLGKA